MSRNNHILEMYAKNGVVPLRELRRRNYPLFKYVTSNFDQVYRVMEDKGILLLDDTISLREPNKIKMYLMYHFKTEVNLTNLRRKHKTIYNYLSEIGSPSRTLQDWGFIVTYSHTKTEEYIITNLKQLCEGGVISKPIPTSLYNRIHYRARTCDMTVTQYIKDRLGFEWGVDPATIKKMRDDGISVTHIAKSLGISESTVYRYSSQTMEG